MEQTIKTIAKVNNEDVLIMESTKTSYEDFIKEVKK